MKDRCKLFCRVAGTTAYYQLKDRVIDGTPCGTDTYDICVQGLCRVKSVLRFHGNGPQRRFDTSAERPGAVLTFCLPVVCGSSASGLRPRPQLQGQERQMRRLRRRQLVVQNHGWNLQRCSVRSVPIALLSLYNCQKTSADHLQQLWCKHRRTLAPRALIFV